MAEKLSPSGPPGTQGQEPVRLLIMGCGNPLAGDDSAGPEIVARLKAYGDQGCLLRAVPFISLDLLESLPAADVVLFVDAVSSGAPPGTLHLVPLLSPAVVPRALGTFSSHGWGLAEALNLARALRRTLPCLMLLGVEAGGVKQGAARSPEVERAIALVVGRFPRLRSLLLNVQSALWCGERRFLPEDSSFPGE